jgi:hypothetical protein
VNVTAGDRTRRAKTSSTPKIRRVMSQFRRIDRCRICGNRELIPVLHLGDQSLTGVFPRTRGEALTRGPLELVKCVGESEACGLLQLRHSYDSTELYGANYGYRSGLNRSMVAHLRAKVDALRSMVALEKDDLVLDIGSNDGTTLSFYPDSLIRVGMDPTAARFAKFYEHGLVAIADFFSAHRFRAEFGDRKAKIVTSIAMFYDLESPLQFVEEVAQVLHDDGVWHFEQSYMPLMLARTAYDTICHEHLEYYSLRQIEWMLDRCELKLVDVELNDVNGGSFAVTVCKRSSGRQPNTAAILRARRDEHQLGAERLSCLGEFADRVAGHRTSLLSLLDRLESEGARVLGYGASTKGNVILQFCGITSERLPFIAEVNEDKFGCFTPGTEIPIISEEEALAMMPEYFLVMPWHFRENLMEREAEFLRRGGKMIFPLPTIEVVNSSR